MQIGNKSLPPETVVEVLLRLSVASLLRCKSVCKLWHTLISDPRFVNSHLSLSTHNNSFVNHRLIYFSSSTEVTLTTCSLHDVMNAYSVNNPLEANYPMKSLSKIVSIVDCCNGLVCIVVDQDTLFIWNPSTRKSTALPKCDPGWDGWYGFGYDESSDDYKVVAMDLDVSAGAYRNNMKMYGLKTGKWKDIGGFPHGNAEVGSCTFINGAFHWMSGRSDSVYPYRIVSLDLATETYGEVLRPECDYEGDRLFFSLGVLGEWLTVVCKKAGRHADIWVMKAYGAKESWTKLLSVEFPSNVWTCYGSFPLCMSDEGKILYNYGRSLVLYDSKRTTFLDVNSDAGILGPYTFVESLVSPAKLGR